MNIQKAASDGRAGFNPFSFITAKCTCEALCIIEEMTN